MIFQKSRFVFAQLSEILSFVPWNWCINFGPYNTFNTKKDRNSNLFQAYSITGIKKETHFVTVMFAAFLFLMSPSISFAYPIYAQQGYENPREATGRMVCANCHLAQKPVDIEVPQAVLPDTVFEAVVKIPYDTQIKQVLGNGKKGGLNVGAVLVLPEGFQVAPEERISEELKGKINNLVFTPYSETRKNILVVGPVPGKTYREMTFPILSPDPAMDKSVEFLKYPIYLGGNRGRGQIYPTGEKSNNTLYQSSVAGKINTITKTSKKGAYDIVIMTNDGQEVTEKIPAGPELVVTEGQVIKADDPLTNNPNVGGFGQTETEIVLQDPIRVQGLILFFMFTIIGQVFLVLKKKQYEKVQLAEMNF